MGDISLVVAPFTGGKVAELTKPCDDFLSVGRETLDYVVR
jgi:hypothetical protein